jgi:hypothetical protein
MLLIMGTEPTHDWSAVEVHERLERRGIESKPSWCGIGLQGLVKRGLTQIIHLSRARGALPTRYALTDEGAAYVREKPWLQR